MNRIVAPDNTGMDEHNGSESITTIITSIIKTMRQVPDNHYVWKYSNPTRTYYVQGLDENRNGDNPLELLLRPQNDTILHQFIDWYENQLMVAYELRQTISPLSPQVLLDSPEPSTDVSES